MALHRVALSDFIDASKIRLGLSAQTRRGALQELLGVMGFNQEDGPAILETLLQREAMGSTGIGRGIAVPHCRTALARRLQVAYGRRSQGIDYQSIDGQPVVHLFLLVAPPIEVSNDYLPVLGRIAQLAKDPALPARLTAVTSPEEFLGVLAEQSV
jgi:mannitol/fructose-specific phosphotransferase system IIA component (Ntr-type)